MDRNPIPGNTLHELGPTRDISTEALETRLRKLQNGQQANMRQHPRYVAEVRRLSRLIADRRTYGVG